MMRKLTSILVAILFFGFTAYSQNFEPAKISGDDFQELDVKVGGDFAIQLQSLDHEAPNVTLKDLPHNFNLPTANLNITADLAPGIQLYINNFMSSRHHNEAWVEGGYLIIDKLPFLPAADNIMEYITIKAGVMSPNYGDAHFYRSNNAAVTNNPFVGNWIMDSYTTNPGIEFMYRNKGIIAMAGTNNGRLNYGRGNDILEDLVFNWKLGYDTQINDDLRVRATVSGYHVPTDHSGSYLWGGDRAGARYYGVMDTISGDNYKSGRWDPASGQTEMSSYQANLFVQFHGFELFGMYETMKGVRKDLDQNFTQLGVQAKYTIGAFYLATRYNSVDDNLGSTATRLNFGGGWNMVNNVLIKLDYVTQSYEGIAHAHIDGGKFNGLVMEAAISF